VALRVPILDLSFPWTSACTSSRPCFHRAPGSAGYASRKRPNRSGSRDGSHDMAHPQTYGLRGRRLLRGFGGIIGHCQQLLGMSKQWPSTPSALKRLALSR